MKLTVPIIVFGLLQLSSPFVVAIADDENNQEGQRNLRRGDDQEVVNEDLSSEESERELRPFGYPAPIRRPGQTQKYGLNSLLGFRPYTNPNRFVAQPLPQQGVRAPPKSAKSTKATKAGARPPRANPGFVRSPGPNLNQDGTVAVIGIPRQPGSLAQALGFFRVEPGTPIVIVEAVEQVTEQPTGSPAPTTSPKPTGTPTRTPTRNPTLSPTKAPTGQPTRPPTGTPTISPTRNPTQKPTKAPSKEPTRKPTKQPTSQPTKKPTGNPTRAPTRAPTKIPTLAPTVTPAS